MEPEFDISGYFAALRRRILFLIIPAVVISLSGIVFANILPPLYVAKATILVESQQIPTALATPTVTADASERIQIIQQRLMARDNLLEIAGKFDLFAYEGSRRTPTSIVDSMRDSISISQIDVGGRSREANVIGFTVSFRYRSAAVSSRVTNELVASILSQNLETRLGRASETAKFFQDQQREIDQRILALETRIADYKRENAAALPETMGERRALLAEIQAQISAIDLRLQATTLSSNAGIDLTAPGDTQASYTLLAKQLELESLKEQLEEIGALAEKGFVAKNKLRELEQAVKLAELNIEALKAQINAQGGIAGNSNDMISLLESQKEKLSAQAEALSADISRSPLVEVELNSMNRDYENLQNEYRQSQARLEDAMTGERLEQDRQSERFEVIEQATTPSEPSEPNRPRIMIAGTFGGISVGVGLVILLELLNKSIYSPNDLERKLQLRPIATIPYVSTSADVRRRRLKILVITAITAAFFAVLLVGIHIYYRPLDFIFARILQSASGLFSTFLGRV